jgi:hypothetical protein
VFAATARRRLVTLFFKNTWREKGQKKEKKKRERGRSKRGAVFRTSSVSCLQLDEEGKRNRSGWKWMVLQAFKPINRQTVRNHQHHPTHTINNLTRPERRNGKVGRDAKLLLVGDFLNHLSTTKTQ